MGRQALPPNVVGVACVRHANSQTVESASIARTCSSLEELGGASRPASDDVVPTWPSRVQMLKKRI